MLTSSSCTRPLHLDALCFIPTFDLRLLSLKRLTSLSSVAYTLVQVCWFQSICQCSSKKLLLRCTWAKCSRICPISWAFPMLSNSTICVWFCALQVPWETRFSSRPEQHKCSSVRQWQHWQRCEWLEMELGTFDNPFSKTCWLNAPHRRIRVAIPRQNTMIHIVRLSTITPGMSIVSEFHKIYGRAKLNQQLLGMNWIIYRYLHNIDKQRDFIIH